MSESRWRDICAPIIKRVLAENAGKTESQIQRALRESYPFGEKAMHPYKIWRDEIAVQLGRKLAPHLRGPAAKAKLAASRADETVRDLFSDVMDLFPESHV